MFKRNHVCAIAAMAAISMLTLTACGDENSDITNVPEESELSSSSTPSVEAESSSSELVLSSSSAPAIESSSSVESSSSSEEDPSDRELTEADVKCSATKPHPVDGDECSYKNDDGYLKDYLYVDGGWRESNADSTFVCARQSIILVNCIKNRVRIIITVSGVNGSLPLWFLNNLRILEKRA